MKAFPQLSFNPLSYRSQLRMDPGSRCAALSLPKDGLAILPIYQSQADLDVGEQDQAFARWVQWFSHILHGSILCVGTCLTRLALFLTLL